MDTVLSPWSLRKLRKGDLVKHSGMLCIVLGFMQNRLGIKLRAPDDTSLTVKLTELIKKFGKRTEALLSVRVASRGVKEYPGYLVASEEALGQFRPKPKLRKKRRKLNRG